MTLIRVFISVPIPDTSPLEGVLGDLGAVKGVKVSPRSQLHVTLRFIGDVDDRKVPRIVKAVEDAVEEMEPFTVSLGGVGTFPPRGNPRVVWVGLEPEGLLKGLSERISANLRDVNIRFDEKPFKGHVTVGRCNGPVDLSGFLKRHGDGMFLEFECSEVMVMRSILDRRGATHVSIGRVEIG